MDITFVPAGPEDAQRLTLIYNAAFYADYLRYGECPGYGRTAAQMEASIRRFPKYIIRCDGEPVGALACRRLEPGVYALSCLCVVPAFQRRGIGTRAVEFALRRCADWTRFTLITPADHADSVRFYTQRCGFSVAGEEMDGRVRVVRLVRERHGAEKA